jgi:O-antigen/teichoic acid export membrane protein
MERVVEGVADRGTGLNATTPDTDSEGLRQRVVSGSMTLIMVNIAGALIGFVNIAIVARILSPEDYGIMAFAFIALEMAKVFTDLQVSNALIRLGRIGESHYRTAFTIALLRGLLVGGGIYLASSPLAAFFNEPRLAPVLQAMAIIPLLDSFASPRMIDFIRDIDFRREAAMSILSRIVTVAVTIVGAVAIGNYWSFVFGALAGSIFNVATTYRFAPWRPRLGVEHAGMVLRFGVWLNATSIVGFFNGQIDKIILGQFLGTATLGLYSVGVQMSGMVTSKLAAPFSRAVFAGLSRLENNRERLKAAYYRAQGGIVAVVLPIGVGTGLVADHVVLALVGAKWQEAIIVVQFVAPIVAMTTVTAGVHSLLMVMGRTSLIFRMTAINLVIRVIVMTAAVYQYGLIGLLMTRLLTGIFQIISFLYVASTVTGDSVWTSLLRAWRSFAAAFAMILVVLVIDWLTSPPDTAVMANLIMLAIKACAGGVIYGAAHLGLWHATGRPDGVERTALEMAQRVLNRLRQRLGSSPDGDAPLPAHPSGDHP